MALFHFHELSPEQRRFVAERATRLRMQHAATAAIDAALNGAPNALDLAGEFRTLVRATLREEAHDD